MKPSVLGFGPLPVSMSKTLSRQSDEFIKAMRRRGRTRSFFDDTLTNPEKGIIRSKANGTKGTCSRMSNRSMKKGIEIV